MLHLRGATDNSVKPFCKSLTRFAFRCTMDGRLSLGSLVEMLRSRIPEYESKEALYRVVIYRYSGFSTAIEGTDSEALGVESESRSIIEI